MANPRKFSEKIALHNQKQAEETAAFQKIMEEVMNVRPTGGPVNSSATVSIPQNNSNSQNHNHVQPQQNNHLSISIGSYARHGGSLPNVNQMAQPREKSTSPHRGYGGGVSPRSSNRGSIGPVRTRSRADVSPYASPPSASMLSSSMSSTSPGGFGHSSSPYASHHPISYLSPPIESCRRFNSDSALNMNTLLIPSTVPDSSEDSSNASNDPREPYSTPHSSPSGLGYNNANCSGGGGRMMSQSGGGGSCRSPTSGHLEIPLPPSSMSSTGSLPDLTNFHFPPPLSNPLDLEDLHHHPHSPYSTSPLTGSSITYSPTSSHASPQGAGNGNGQQHVQTSQVQISSSPHSPSSAQISQQQSHSSDNSINNSSFQPPQTQNHYENMLLTAYRIPRPSPQNSPSPFRSPSPLDGHLSGPSSPSQGQNNQASASDFYLNQAQTLQQHFEQISVKDPVHKVNSMQMNRQWQGPNGYFCSQISNNGSGTSQQSPQHCQPQTPQTPSSIPDIIFTDFSDSRGTDQLQLEELLASEQLQAFRDGLGPIDFDGFQMLDQPDLVQLDPQVEDSFRLDRL